MQAFVTLLVAVVMVALGTISYATEDLLALTNADRSAKGLAPLTSSPDLNAFAQLRAEEMMRAGRVWHTPNLGAKLTNWVLLGENVGRGSTLSKIQTAFMASPTHRDNILRREFSQAGIGVAWDGVGRFYVAVIFRQPMKPAGVVATPVPVVRARSSPPTTSRPAPAPSPAPASSPGPSPPPTSTTTAVPPLPSPSPEPAPVEQPAPAAREASLHLGRVLETTRGDSMASLQPPFPAFDAPGRTELAFVATPDIGSLGKDPSSPALVTTAALLAVLGAWIGVMAVANLRQPQSALAAFWTPTGDYTPPPWRALFWW